MVNKQVEKHGEEKMATSAEVVKMWDEKHPNRQTEIQTHYGNRKIASGPLFGEINEWAVIRLADNYLFEPYYEQLCYVFDFPHNGRFKIGFYRRGDAPGNINALEIELEKFNNRTINGKKITLKNTGHNTLMLRIEFDQNASAEYICDYMEKFIELTQKPICDFLSKKSGAKLVKISPKTNGKT